MAPSTSVPPSRSEASEQSARRLGGVSAVLLGAALIADLAVFAAYTSSTGVTIPGNNPAAYPEAFAHSLANGANSPYWMWYLVMAALAVFTFTFVQTLADRLNAAGSRLPTRALGTAALVVYLVIALASATVEREAGSAVLTRAELVTSIPVLFGVLIPVLLASFNLLFAAWILAASWAGWRTNAQPGWLCVLGGLTSIVLLAGISGMPGVEVLAGPWLIAAGVWMFTTSPVQRPTP